MIWFGKILGSGVFSREGHELMNRLWIGTFLVSNLNHFHAYFVPSADDYSEEDAHSRKEELDKFDMEQICKYTVVLPQKCQHLLF